MMDLRSQPKAAGWGAFVRLFPWIVAAAMALAAIRNVYPLLLHPLVSGALTGELWSYTAAQNQLNWLTTGFMRRELYNTLVGLVGLSGPDAMVSNAIVFLVFYAILAIVLIWCVSRRKPSAHQAALAVICLAVLLRFSVDVGRSDVAVILCGLVAAWASRAGRWAVVATAISVALAVHETGMIFLAPVVCAIVWEQRAWRDIRWPSVVAGAALMAVGLGLYVIGSKAQLDVQGLARQVHAQFPDPRWADMAMYFNLAGFRTIPTSWCVIALESQYWLQVLGGAFILTLLSITLRPKRWWVTLAAALIPYLAISCIATDVGRWVTFGVASILILALTQPAEEDSASWMFAAVALLAFPLMTRYLGPGSETTAIPWINALNRHHDLDTPSAEMVLDTCDPGWRDLLGLPALPTAAPKP